MTMFALIIRNGWHVMFFGSMEIYLEDIHYIC